MKHTVKAELREIVTGVVSHEVLIYKFDDGSEWVLTTGWEFKPRAGWRSGKTTVSRADFGGDERRSTYAAFIRKLAGSQKITGRIL